MVSAVGVGERMQRVIGVDAKAVGGNEDGTGCAERDVASARAHNARADSRSGIIARAGHNLDRFRQAQLRRGRSRQHAGHFVAFKQLRHLLFAHRADLQHFL